MLKDRMISIGLLVLLALFGVWMAMTFEWAEKEVPAPLRGEAATNPLYATHRLVRELGGRVVTPGDGLSVMPPAGSTLYLNLQRMEPVPRPRRKTAAVGRPGRPPGDAQQPAGRRAACRSGCR
jgi:hypothetical protein